MFMEHLLCTGTRYMLAHFTLPEALELGCGLVLQPGKLRLRKAKGAMARIRTQVRGHHPQSLPSAPLDFSPIEQRNPAAEGLFISILVSNASLPLGLQAWNSAANSL